MDYAGEWLDTYKSENPLGVPRHFEKWEQLKLVIIDGMISKNHKDQLIENLADIRQNNMPTLEFTTKFNSILAQLPGLELRVIRALFFRAIRPDIRDHIKGVPENLTSWKSLKQAANQFSKPLSVNNNTNNNYNSGYNTSQRPHNGSQNNPSGTAHAAKPANQFKNKKNNKSSLNEKAKDATCMVCNQKGHFNRYCPKVTEFIDKSKTRANIAESQNFQAINFTIDSGCTQHMVPESVALTFKNNCEVEIKTA